GYTGEDGFEAYVPSGHEPKVWDAFLKAGEAHGLTAIGLGARDTLRHEAGMPLYGHEINETTNPLEANLSWAVKMNHDFVGKEALERVTAAGGTGRKLVGLITHSKRCPREGYPIASNGKTIGAVCSGSISPTLSKSGTPTNIATAYVETEFAAIGTELQFVVRDKASPPCRSTSAPASTLSISPITSSSSPRTLMRPDDLKFQKSHEWCRVEGETATIGISDYAVSHLNDLVFLDLPAVGATVTIGESFGEIESVKAVSSLYSPVTGEVIESNEELGDNLEWLSEEPFGKAWMVKVKISAAGPDLMDVAAYDSHCKAEG
ncbi:MAG TPA: glycine cleavage system protein GcvH, partial [Planctomycetes bacterium]|nr:glycine cleavage system protein GcvH [Planctomycetota bacterium]